MTHRTYTTNRDQAVKEQATTPIALDLLNSLEEETSDLVALADLVMSWWVEANATAPGPLPLDDRDRRKIDFAVREIFERAQRASALLDVHYGQHS